jgi:hypothetical protein
MGTDRENSFGDLLEALREDHFEIEIDIDSEEVFAFVNWIESAG